jgi:hypothetical protein
MKVVGIRDLLRLVHFKQICIMEVIKHPHPHYPDPPRIYTEKKKKHIHVFYFLVLYLHEMKIWAKYYFQLFYWVLARGSWMEKSLNRVF